MSKSPTARSLSLIVVLTGLLLASSGCYSLFTGTGSRGYDNALQVNFERPPEEALSDFRTFAENNGLDIASMNGRMIKTRPGAMGQGRGPSTLRGPDIRIIAVAEPDDDESELVVVTEYQNASSGSWERAKFRANWLGPGSGRGRSDTQVMQQLYGALVRRYGTENIKRASSDLSYSSEQVSAASPGQRKGQGDMSDRPVASASTESDDGARANSDARTSANRPGDGGDDVAWVQRTLNELDHDCGSADGVMGANTRSCIRSFQKANGLDVTGEVNEATYELMLERL